MNPRTAWRWGALALSVMIVGLAVGLRSRSDERFPAGPGPSAPAPAVQEAESRTLPSMERSISPGARPVRDELKNPLEDREKALQKRLDQFRAAQRSTVPAEMEASRREAIEQIRQAAVDPAGVWRPKVELGAPLIGVEEHDPRERNRKTPATSP